jgi:o-succinylbenzoate synthase
MRRADFALDLATPFETARETIRQRRGWLIGIDAGGHRGVGEATPLPGWTESHEACRDALAGVEDPATALDALASTPAARHGVSLAIADARARAADLPLASWLGDDPRDRVPVNATVGDAGVKETVAAAETAVEEGFRALKVKVAAGDLDRDVERLRAVREAVGGDVALRADANGAWDRTTAARAVDAFSAVDLEYLEQPLPAGDLAGHAALRGRGVQIALDESLREATLTEVLSAGAAGVIVLKPMILGGPDRAMDAAARASEAGVDVTVTTTVDAAVARTGAVHVAAAVDDVRPCGLATGSLLADDLGPDPVPVQGGAIRVPRTPGLAGERFDDLVFRS